MARIGALDLKAPMAHGAARGFCVPIMPGKHVIQPFFQQHIHRRIQPVQKIGGRRIGEIARRVGSEHRLPIPEAARQFGRVTRFQCLGADGVEGKPRRQHQPLLRARYGNIHAPFIMPVIHGPE